MIPLSAGPVLPLFAWDNNLKSRETRFFGWIRAPIFLGRGHHSTYYTLPLPQSHIEYLARTLFTHRFARQLLEALLFVYEVFMTMIPSNPFNPSVNG